ncbi:extracellular trypsin protease [Neoconidiobolus thromboides FSU 785]|nr:extracellular trypsin protease [Neoconidiobolus thromboides FSU 785]
MKFSLYSLFLIAGVVSGQDQRIINGQESVPFSHPFVVSLQRSGSHFCGGSILDRNTIITAAHCSQTTPSSVTVNVHRHDLRKTAASENGASLLVKSINSHPQYSSNTLTYDVSVWKLAAPIPSNIQVEFVTLDSSNIGQTVGLQTIGVGWGRTNPNTNTLSPVLREAILPVYSHDPCNTAYGNFLKKEHHICAGYKEGLKSACNGDSGSPLFVKQGGNIQVGIASFVSGSQCLAPEAPTVYSRVNTYISFIRQIQSKP